MHNDNLYGYFYSHTFVQNKIIIHVENFLFLQSKLYSQFLLQNNS